jgi:hypothetical protein
MGIEYHQKGEGNLKKTLGLVIERTAFLFLPATKDVLWLSSLHWITLNFLCNMREVDQMVQPTQKLLVENSVGDKICGRQWEDYGNNIDTN